MKNKITFRLLIAIFPLVLLFGGVITGQSKPAYPSCSKTTDAQIARLVRNKIKKIQTANSGQSIWIRVKVKNRVVTLSGRSATKKIASEVRRYAKNLKCVVRVKDLTFFDCPGSPNHVECPEGFYACQGKCRPCDEICTP